MEGGIKSQLLFELDLTFRSPITRRCFIANIVMIVMVNIILIRS